MPLAQEMPGHDVGVMLQDRQDDFVAGLQTRHRPGIGDHVDPLGRARVQDDLILTAGPEEPGDSAAHAFVFVRGKVRKIVQTPVNV